MAPSNKTSAKASQQAAASKKTTSAVQSPANKENNQTSGQRGSRERRVSEKVAQQLRDVEEAAARKAEAEARRAAREKKARYKRDKAAGITQNPDDSGLEENTDSVFISHTVPSKPTTVTALAQRGNQTAVKRAGKIPPAPSTRLGESDVEPNITSDEEEGEQPSHYSVRRHAVNSDPEDDEGPEPTLSPFGSRSPSPTVGDKRSRSDDMDVDAALGLVKAQKITDNTGRPKASDYNDVGKEVILSAAGIFRCLVSTVDGMPDSTMELEFVRIAWKRANDETGVAPMVLTPAIGKIIKQRGSQTRGEAKTKIASLVETMYGFDSGHGRKTIAANRKLAEDLKFQKGFIYKILTAESRKGIYEHPIIQKAVNRMWFKNKRDEGVVYSDMFNPMPVPAIALILTAIECNIDEWVTGTKTDITFYADDYRKTYRKHIESLNSFGEETRKCQLLERLQKRLHNYGRLHSGATPFAYEDVPAIPISAFKAALKEYEEADETDSSDGEMEL